MVRAHTHSFNFLQVGACSVETERSFFAIPPLTSSSIVFIGAPGWIHTKVLPFPFHRSFISPSALAASSSSSRRARVPVPRFWLSRLSAGVATADRRVSKGRERAIRGPYLAKCRKDNLGLYRNIDSAGRSLDLRLGSTGKGRRRRILYRPIAFGHVSSIMHPLSLPPLRVQTVLHHLPAYSVIHLPVVDVWCVLFWDHAYRLGPRQTTQNI